MATKAELEATIVSMTAKFADLEMGYSMLREQHADVLTELKEAQEQLAAKSKKHDTFPWNEDAPVSSYKQRMAIAKAQAMQSGKAVRV